MTDPDALYAGWYVWARRNLSNDVAVCHAAAAAAAAVEAAGGPREDAIAAARQSTTSGAHLAAGDAEDRRRRTYAEWFDWARRELGGLREQQAAAARAALAALESGAGPEAAQRAARAATGLAEPAPPPPPPPPPPVGAAPGPPWSVAPGAPPPGWVPAPFAGVGWRLGAYAIDYAVLLGGLLLMAVFAGVLLGLAGAAAGSTTPPSTDVLQVPLWILSLVGSWLYYTLLESSAWQGTLGKRLLHLRVSDEGGRRITWARANGRYFAKILSSLACGLGYLWAAFNPRRQGWHDLLAKTLVLRG